MKRIERLGAQNNYYYDGQLIKNKEDYKELQFRSDVENNEFYLRTKDFRGSIIDITKEHLNVKEITEYPGVNKYVISDDGRIIRCTGFTSYNVINEFSQNWELESYTTTEVKKDKNGRVRIQGTREQRNKIWEKYWPEEYAKAHQKDDPILLENEDGEEWKFIEGTENLYISNHQRIKSVSKEGNERERRSIITSAGNKLSKISVLKKYWDIDIYWTGDEDGEIWAGIDDASDIEVSNHGRVRTTNYKDTGTKRLMKTWTSNGYEYVSYLDDKGNTRKRLVHRLVAQAFLPNPDNKPEVDHKNTNRSDNNVDNLSWVSKEENTNNPLSHINRVQGQKNRWKK